MRNPFTHIIVGALAALLSDLCSPSPAFAQCADFNDDGSVTAVDALGVLQTAIGLQQCEAHRCDVDGSGSISATDALSALALAVGQPYLPACPDDPNQCLNDMEFFFQKISTPILSDCVICHNAVGAASYTEHVLLPDTEAGYLEYNFNVLKNLAVNKADLILAKPQGIAHGGGQRLGITPASPHYANLVELLDRFDNPVTDCGPEGEFWADVTFLSDVETLRKATMLLAGRRPTPAEEAAVVAGGDVALRTTIRQAMEGEDFESFVKESANDRFLTDKYLLRQSNAFGVLQGDYQYPDLYRRIDQIEALIGEDEAHDAWERTNRALAREPLELIAYIARTERPYTEVVTADYVMVNPWTDPVYKSYTGIGDEWNDDMWLPGRNYGYRLPGYPHAGILSSPMFLARFPSTATNRNRARARWVYKFFLGVDVESLAVRTVDPADLGDMDNPTLNNPNCTQCHSVLDPLAGAFQNIGDDGIYLENDSDSLPWSYKSGELYEHGDRWYRDMRTPGFNGAGLPESQRDASLTWAGQQIAADPRFARGAVDFWYEGLFGRAPLQRPTDPSAQDYPRRLAAFLAQDEELDGIAAKFRDGTAGTGIYGPFNLKDLLVEISLSRLFTANGSTNPTAQRMEELAEVGFARLLTPEQLNRKFESTTGHVWARSYAPDEPYLLDRYRLFYGGIDSSGITKRADELNALMSTVPQRMAYETACPIAVSEFSVPASQRRLFPLVEPSDLPEDATGEDRIRANIAWLHRWLLGEEVASDDPEVSRTLDLFSDVRALRIADGKPTNLKWGSGYCDLDFGDGDYIETDDNHTIRAWIAVLSYMLSDYRFIYE